MIIPSSRSPFHLRRPRDSRAFVFSFIIPCLLLSIVATILGFLALLSLSPLPPHQTFLLDIHVTNHSCLYAYHPIRIVYVAGFNSSILST